MATIVLDSKTVLEMCNKALNSIRAARANEDFRTINDLINNPPARFSWRRMRWVPLSFNIGTAEAYLDNLHKTRGYEYGWIGWRSTMYYGYMQHIKTLKALAELGDPVTLNEKDVEALTF